MLTDAMIIWKPKDSWVSLLGKVRGVCTGVWMCVRACLLITTLIFNALSQCIGGAAMVNYVIVRKKSNSLLTQYRLFQYIIVPLTFIWSPASPSPQCLCPTLLWPLWTLSLPGSSIHEISQARTLEWVSISFSKGSSWSRIKSTSPALASGGLYHWAIRGAPCWFTLYLKRGYYRLSLSRPKVLVTMKQQHTKKVQNTWTDTLCHHPHQ